VDDPGDSKDPIDRLRKAAEAPGTDATRVQLLAAILVGWAKPVPHYEPDDRNRLKSGPSEASKKA
jgi:hypothetical protein